MLALIPAELTQLYLHGLTWLGSENIYLIVKTGNP